MKAMKYFLLALLIVISCSSVIAQITQDQVKDLLRLAEQGNGKAQYVLGAIYYAGKGVKKDYKKAVKWTRLAAEQGNSKGQYNLGTLYLNGRGVRKDYIKAYMWFSLSGMLGDKAAIKERDRIQRQLNPMELKKAQQLANHWKLNAIQNISRNVDIHGMMGEINKISDGRQLGRVVLKHK